MLELDNSRWLTSAAASGFSRQAVSEDSEAALLLHMKNSPTPVHDVIAAHLNWEEGK